MSVSSSPFLFIFVLLFLVTSDYLWGLIEMNLVVVVVVMMMNVGWILRLNRSLLLLLLVVSNHFNFLLNLHSILSDCFEVSSN